MTSVALLSQDELQHRRYRGMNPSFVRAVWAKRRRERENAPVAPKEKAPEQQPSIAEKAESFRVTRLKAQMAEGGVKAIIAEVALKHRVTYEDIVGPRRVNNVVAARFEAIATVRERRPHLSLKQIARFFKRDHTSIMNALEKHKRMEAAN